MSVNSQHFEQIAKIMALFPRGMTPREIHKIYGYLAPRTVRLALSEMIDLGLARYEGQNCYRRYFAVRKESA